MYKQYNIQGFLVKSFKKINNILRVNGKKADFKQSVPELGKDPGTAEQNPIS